MLISGEICVIILPQLFQKYFKMRLKNLKNKACANKILRFSLPKNGCHIDFAYVSTYFWPYIAIIGIIRV